MFLTNSEYLKKIKNLASMARELNLSVYIRGEKGVGKSTLAKYIAGKNLLIENFDKKPFVPKKFPFAATGTKPLNKTFLKHFDIEIELKPLKEHPEDIEFFINHFIKKAEEELKTDKKIVIKSPDISENLNSLKRQVYKEFLKPDKNEIYIILKEILKKEHLSYEEEINNFEKTLFEAMKEKYTSKLKISEKLKINRVTLTKKMKVLGV